MKKLTKLGLLLVLPLLSAKTMAFTVSTYRLFLNNDSPEQDFYVSNRDALDQDCRIILKDIFFDENGKVKEYQGKDLAKITAKISAKELLRYSPKSFQITSGSNQKVRFKYRRKKTTLPTEYRSYLSLTCSELNDETSGTSVTKKGPQIQAQVRHNIPIIVRMDDIEVDVKFTRITTVNNSVSFSLVKTGKRSIYGDIVMVNNKTNEEIHRKRAISLPVEVGRSSFTLPLFNLSPTLIDLKFIENNELGVNAFAEATLSIE
jgi:P pilus assembly chaperone PapD